MVGANTEQEVAMRNRTSVFAILTVFLLLLVLPSWTAPPDKPPEEVQVTNFPDPQNVVGTVSVDNLPAVQQVAGEIAINNLPLDETGALRVNGPRATTSAILDLGLHAVSVGEGTFVDPVVVAGFGLVTVEMELVSSTLSDSTFLEGDVRWGVSGGLTQNISVASGFHILRGTLSVSNNNTLSLTLGSIMAPAFQLVLGLTGTDAAGEGTVHVVLYLHQR